MAKIKELSIFFPFWNEQKNIEKVVENAKNVAEKVAQKWEIIMVDDGSKDNTLKIANKLASLDKRLKVVSHQPNRGYGAALAAGFANSEYNYIVFTDGDLQFDFSEVTKFIEKIDKADIVIGYRKKRRDKKLFKRLLLMYLLKVWDRILFKFTFQDIDCAFKMFRRSAVDQLLPLRSEGAMVSTEILAKAKRKKMKIIEVGVTHYPRIEGHQSGANGPVIMRAVLESLILWWDLKNGRF
ncbi:MAG TPA: glycosyltransferase family 2 protein [Candidatus Saccharimonadales bacterium]|nr:glycosyltransferase family 2 protein [Candidatus Saccharimonadales bacterium]